MQEENLTEQKERLRSRAVCVVIPTYNNAGTILDVVRRSLEQCDDVIVVCDGGDDPTVAKQITDAVSAALGIGANRISVLKMKQTEA